MKTLIVGTGIIGTIYGWALAEAGIDVTHYVRKGCKDNFSESVTLDVLDERKGHPKKNVTQYKRKCVESIAPSDNYELIIVPTGAHQVQDVLWTLVPVSGHATFLIFSGIWEGVEFIDHLLPRSRYVLGYPDGGGTIRDGVYWVNLGAEVHLGEPGGKPTEKLDKVAAYFKQVDMQPDIQEHMLHWLWQHIAGTVGYAAGFAKHHEMDAFLKDGKTLRLCTRSTKELYKLCARRGVNFKHYPETRFRRWPVWLVNLFLRWNFRRNESMQRYTAHAASESNLREMKEYYDAMMKTAKKLKFEAPYTHELGQFLQQANVKSEVRREASPAVVTP